MFYSKIKYLWLRKSIEVFNNKDEKLIEIKHTGLFNETCQTMWQSEILKLKINSMKSNEILLNNNSKILYVLNYMVSKGKVNTNIKVKKLQFQKKILVFEKEIHYKIRKY